MTLIFHPFLLQTCPAVAIPQEYFQSLSVCEILMVLVAGKTSPFSRACESACGSSLCHRVKFARRLMVLSPPSYKNWWFSLHHSDLIILRLHRFLCLKKYLVLPCGLCTIFVNFLQ